jgi:hypothetical protein
MARCIPPYAPSLFRLVSFSGVLPAVYCCVIVVCVISRLGLPSWTKDRRIESFIGLLRPSFIERRHRSSSSLNPTCYDPPSITTRSAHHRTRRIISIAITQLERSWKLDHSLYPKNCSEISCVHKSFYVPYPTFTTSTPLYLLSPLLSFHLHFA